MCRNISTRQELCRKSLKVSRLNQRSKVIVPRHDVFLLHILKTWKRFLPKVSALNVKVHGYFLKLIESKYLVLNSMTGEFQLICSELFTVICESVISGWDGERSRGSLVSLHSHKGPSRHPRSVPLRNFPCCVCCSQREAFGGTRSFGWKRAPVGMATQEWRGRLKAACRQGTAGY